MSRRVELACRYVADCNIRNINTALEMFVCDYGKRPLSLTELEPNYLRKVPPGDWGYSGSPLTSSGVSAEELEYNFEVPPDWKPLSRVMWEKGKQFLVFRVAGPYSADRPGEAWLQERSAEQAGWSPGTATPAAFGALRGTELRGESMDFRYHRYLLTDGEVGWEFSYSAHIEEWSNDSDEMFVELLRSKLSPKSDRPSPD
jgi:hypothetical protein